MLFDSPSIVSVEHPEGNWTEPAARSRTEEVFRDYGPRVFNLARRMTGNDADAEDVTQEVLVQVVSKMDSFRGDAQLTTWLYRVTVNTVLMDRRKKARRGERQVAGPVDKGGEGKAHRGLVSESMRPDLVAEDRECRRLIERAVAALPDMYREVFVLADMEGLPNAEVSAILDLSLAAVKSRLHRARLLLRDALSAYFKERRTDKCRLVERDGNGLHA